MLRLHPQGRAKPVVASSAVNRQIVRLEDELGTARFDRVAMAPSHPLAKKTGISFDDCRSHAFVQISRLSPSHSLVVPEFTKFWDELEQ